MMFSSQVFSLEFFGLVAEGIPSWSKRSTKQFKVGSSEESFDPLMGLIWLSGMLAARGHDELAHASALSLRSATGRQKTLLAIGTGVVALTHEVSR